MKPIVARFYRSETGSEPVRNWLLSLPAEERKIVGKDIATVEFGWRVGMPVCRSLRDGVHEVRSTIRFWKVEARTYFAAEAGVTLLLHGVEGKGRQDDAIRLATERLKDFRRRASAGQAKG